MKIIKKVKKFLGLELPHLLEDEKEAEIEINGNILKAPKNFYTVNTMESIELFNKAMIESTMTMNEDRELFNLERKTKYNGNRN